jgi:hypothetical protein
MNPDEELCGLTQAELDSCSVVVWRVLSVTFYGCYGRNGMIFLGFLNSRSVGTLKLHPLLWNKFKRS